MKATYVQAGYQGPDQAPFECGNCGHFDSAGACELVAGAIDARGCCNLFSKGMAQPAAVATGQPKLAALQAIRGKSGSPQPTY
jgi:hypothetical protein